MRKKNQDIEISKMKNGITVSKYLTYIVTCPCFMGSFLILLSYPNLLLNVRSDDCDLIECQNSCSRSQAMIWL